MSTYLPNNALGIDISGWQPGIDWKKVDSAGLSIAFVYIKSTEGTGYFSPEFQAQWIGCKTLTSQPLRSSYHYWHAKMDGKAQANWFLLKSQKGELPPVVDVEDDIGLPESSSQADLINAAASLSNFVTTIQDAWGQSVMIYTGPWFWNRLANAASRLTELCDLWGATYRGGITAPDLPDGWKTWRMWQFASGGQIPGIPGNVDMDYFNGNQAALNAWSGGNPAPITSVLTPAEQHDCLWSWFSTAYPDQVTAWISAHPNG